MSAREVLHRLACARRVLDACQGQPDHAKVSRGQSEFVMSLLARKQLRAADLVQVSGPRKRMHKSVTTSALISGSSAGFGLCHMIPLQMSGSSAGVFLCLVCMIQKSGSSAGVMFFPRSVSRSALVVGQPLLSRMLSWLPSKIVIEPRKDEPRDKTSNTSRFISQKASGPFSAGSSIM